MKTLEHMTKFGEYQQLAGNLLISLSLKINTLANKSTFTTALADAALAEYDLAVDAMEKSVDHLKQAKVELKKLIDDQKKGRE